MFTKLTNLLQACLLNSEQEAGGDVCDSGVAELTGKLHMSVSNVFKQHVFYLESISACVFHLDILIGV